jgi:hypothetical protein
VSNFNMWWAKHRPPNATTADWAPTLAAQVDGEIARLSACYAAAGTHPASQPDLAACLGLPHAYDTAYDRMLFRDRLLAQSLYADGLQRWFSVFPRDAFLFIVADDFRADPAADIRRMVAWLRLDAAMLHPRLQAPPPDDDRASRPAFRPVHARVYEGSAQADVLARMRAFLRPHNERLFALLQAKGFGDVAARLRELWGSREGAAAAAAGEH